VPTAKKFIIRLGTIPIVAPKLGSLDIQDDIFLAKPSSSKDSSLVAGQETQTKLVATNFELGGQAEKDR